MQYMLQSDVTHEEVELENAVDDTNIYICLCTFGRELSSGRGIP